MIDIIVRYCGFGEWLPIINSIDGLELYRGKRYHNYELAAERAKIVWDEGLTQNIKDFKEGHPYFGRKVVK